MKKFYSFILFISISLASLAQYWDWARHVRGTENIATECIAIDLNNNIVIGGLSRGTIEFVGSSPLVTITSSTSFNSPFIAKYNPDGTLLWANGLGSTAVGNIKSIVTDNAGNIYAVGSFQGTNFIFRSQDGNHMNLTSGGGFDPYLLKYDPNGNLLWVKRFATASGTVRTLSVILDNSNNIILAGFFTAGELDFGGGITFPFSGSSQNGYIAKFDYGGNLIWARHFPGAWARVESGLALSQTDGFFATITIQTSVTIPGFGTITVANPPVRYELVFVKFNNNGDAQWVRHATSTIDSYGGNFITSNEDGSGYFTGRFVGGITFPNPSGTPVTLTSTATTWDNFIVKYSRDGVLVSAIRWGGTGEEWTRGIDYFNNVVTATGFFTGTMILNPGINADTLISKGGRDAFIVDFDKNLNYRSSTSAGGTLNDEAVSIEFDNDGRPIVGGFFLSPSIIFGTQTLANGGTQQDLFLAKNVVTRIDATSTPACIGGTNGSIDITISSSGIPPINYTVHLGSNLITSGTYSIPFTVPGLAAGIYQITATDSEGISKTIHTTVTQLGYPLLATVNVTHITNCIGAAEGSISITGATGGSGVYEYSINGGTSWQSANIFNNLTAGVYNVMIRDSAFPACPVTLNNNIEITQPAELIVMVSPTNITCNALTDGQILITATGGSGSFQYSINDGISYQSSNTFLNLAPGLYKIKVTDGTCIKSGGSVNIVNPSPIIFDSVVVTDITCSGLIDGTIRVTNVAGGSGVYEFSIDGINFFDNNGVFTGLTADVYDVFIKDSFGCIIQAGTYTINEPTPVIISGVIPQNILLCHGDMSGQITISAMGGTGALNYSIDGGTSWQPAIGSFTGLAAGNYIIKVKDDNDCEAT